jgi:uncharacterized membrane protein
VPNIFSSTLDVIALFAFLAVLVGYGYVTSIPALRRRSISGHMQRQREQWMYNMALRDVRMVDAQLLNGLSQGNAFFASTSAIFIGGLVTLLGSGARVQALLEPLPFAAEFSPRLFEVKLLLMIAIFMFSFFKFAWSFRLTHYTAIRIGATPIPGEGNAVACRSHAGRTACLIGIAAGHADAGLRGFYYAIAAMAWFLHPVALLLATAWVLGILVRRDFFSRSQRLAAGDSMPT